MKGWNRAPLRLCTSDLFTMKRRETVVEPTVSMCPQDLQHRHLGAQKGGGEIFLELISGVDVGVWAERRVSPLDESTP